jgi:hypothetical protein
MAKDFTTEDGRSLDDLELLEPRILEWRDGPEISEYLVRVQWKKTFPESEAKWLDGGFANPNIVLQTGRIPQRSTFLRRLLA